MSALEQTPLPTTTDVIDERRRTPRTRITNSVPVFIGRATGVFVDLSLEGARVRHAVQAVRGSHVRVRFEWDGERFASTAEVLASRVVALSNGTRPTQYESRLRFRLLPEVAAQLLRRVLAAVANEDVRNWVANLHGWSSLPAANAPAPRDGSYLRCRLVRNRWEKKWTQESAQPADGFVLSETTDQREITRLCEAYERLDEDGRHLVRLLATAALV